MATTLEADRDILVKEAEAALRRRDVPVALELLARAEAAAPADTSIKMLKASALRFSGDLDGSLAAIETVLVLEPYNFVALLSKGSLLERLAGPKPAARFYRDILEAAPTEDKTPPGLAAPIAHARRMVAENSAQRV